MKKLLAIIFLLSITFCFSQTKEQLIDSIIKFNMYLPRTAGFGGGGVTTQYKNYKKLKTIISVQELINLSNHKNPILRAYVLTDLIRTNKINIIEPFIVELNKNEMIETSQGCILGVIKPISTIIYNTYLIKKHLINIKLDSTKNKTSEYQREVAIKNKLEYDFRIEKLDSIIIHTKKEVHISLYNETFKHKKQKESYLPRIVELAFKQNNYYAFEYLKKYNSNNYTPLFEKYLKSDFLLAKFETKNEILHFQLFIKYLLEIGNNSNRKIVIEKLNKENTWKKNTPWMTLLLKKHKIEL